MNLILRLTVFLFFLVLVNSAIAQTIPAIEKYNFNAEWKMLVGDRPGYEESSRKRGNNKSIEVGGKSFDEGVKTDNAATKGTLSIIEAEIYEKLIL